MIRKKKELQFGSTIGLDLINPHRLTLLRYMTTLET